MVNMITKKHQKNADKFNCDFCHFKCCKLSDYNRHITRPKHLKNAEMVNNDKNDNNKTLNNAAPFKCCCGKEYTYLSGLSRHKKSCQNINMQINNIIPILTPELVLEILKDNKDMKEIVIEQNKMINELIKNVNNNSTNITNNNNCNNKTFNLQVFLNETCKDAMNIMDFVDSIKLQLSDLESVGELGYVKGLSNIIVKNLRALDVTKRPVHCSDAKREILYVKDNDVWEKEDIENPKMKKAVKYIAYKNTKLLPLWKEKNPECMQYDSSKSDKYNYMVIEAMGGAGDNESEKINKIIKYIAKEVVIDK